MILAAFQEGAMRSIYYAAAWTECGRHMSCRHQHRTVSEAVPCIRKAGGYVVAVDAGGMRSLTPEEEAEFRCARIQPCSGPPMVHATSPVENGQTIGESAYAVITRIRVGNHLKWTTWMCFETNAEAEAHRRDGDFVVRFGSSEWTALLQNCEPDLQTAISAERKSPPHRGKGETLVEFVLRFLTLSSS
jgi:hypothetical protein